LDVLGHWSKGSAMPRSYDSSAGVTEMRTREAIIQQIRLGWRLVNDGSFPMAPIGNVDADNPRILVTNTRSRKVHATKRGMKRSLCGFFTCGSPEEPGSGADFVNTSGSMCKQCNWAMGFCIACDGRTQNPISVCTDYPNACTVHLHLQNEHVCI
jgi:hypothetical protein